MSQPRIRVAAAVLGGVVAGLTLADGDVVAFVIAAALGAGSLLVARAVGGRTGRAELTALVVLAIGVHMSAALLLPALSPDLGHVGGPFLTGDDAVYFRWSEETARYLQGLPVAATYSYPDLVGRSVYHPGTFVYLETALFLLFGPNIRIPLLLNATLAVLTVIVIYATAVHLFERRAALVAGYVVAFYPSLLLWSSLNLRESLVINLGSLAVLSLVLFAMRPGVLSVLVPLVAAAELVNLRPYVSAIIAIVSAFTVALADFSAWRRVAVGVTAVLVAALIVAVSSSAIGADSANKILTSFEDSRSWQAVGARTVIEPTPAQVTEKSPDEGVVERTLRFLPIGLAYAVFAPVPLVSFRWQELVAAPDMVLWYLLCVGTAFTLWRERRQWRALMPPAMMVAGLVFILALGEGSVGGLFRHRGMAVPFVALLAAPTLLLAYDQLPARQHRSRNSHEDKPAI